MLDCLSILRMLPSARKGVLRNNIDPPRLGVAEPHGYLDSLLISSIIYLIFLALVIAFVLLLVVFTTL